MPTYDYVCKSCEHAFEHFQSMTSKPLKKCPECGRMQLKRLIGTGAGIIFKGSGFYETDYRSSEYKEKAKQETGGGESKSDSASKTESASSSEKSDTASSKSSDNSGSSNQGSSTSSKESKTSAGKSEKAD